MSDKANKANKVNKANKANKEVFDFFSHSLQENEVRLNRIMGIIAIVCLAIALLCYSLNEIGVFVLPGKQMLLAVLAMTPFCLYSFIRGTVIREYQPWIKYNLMMILWIILCIMFSRLTMHAVLPLCIPVMMALLYNNRRFLHITATLGLVAIFISHLFSVSFSIVNDPLVNTYYRTVVYGFLPRIIEYSVICLIADYIAVHNSGITERGYFYVERATNLLEQQRNTAYEITNNLATVTENRSLETGEHISRVFRYMTVLTEHLNLSEEEAYNVSLAAMLHDVGKLGVPEEILNKPGKLSPAEFEIIKTHAHYGKQLLSNTENEVLELAGIIAEQHHERWDGNGYYQIPGKEINIYAQLMSVIDVFDALTSTRCYKPAWTFEEAYDEITDKRGTQFSPFAVDLFAECIEDIRGIYEICNPAAEVFRSLQQQ